MPDFFQIFLLLDITNDKNYIHKRYFVYHSNIVILFFFLLL